MRKPEWLLPYLRAILSPTLLAGALVIGFLYLFPTEFLKTVLSSPFVWGSVAVVCLVNFSDEIRQLIRRIAKIRLPGGGELSTSQAELEPKEADEKVPRVPASDIEKSPPVLPTIALEEDQRKLIMENLLAERARAYLWEYRYLTLFLVRGTQEVLAWLAICQMPTSVSLYHSWWLPRVPDPKEREVRLRVLEAHFLVQIEVEIIKVTEKGREYLAWRGELPPNRGNWGSTLEN